MVEITYINRQQCQRVVPMRVLVLGFSRAGTESMRKALVRLGAMRAKYDGVGKPFGRAEFDRLLGHCQAVSDAPAYCFSPELIEAYPDAKVILTLRDVDEWYESMMSATVVPFYSRTNIILNRFMTLTRSPFRFSRPVFTYIIENFFEGFEKNGKKRFQEHYDYIRRTVPKERLLEYRVQEGWEPLCKFLGEPIPDAQFPKGNNKADLDQRIKAWATEEWRRIKRIGLGALSLLAIGVAVRYSMTRR